MSSTTVCTFIVDFVNSAVTAVNLLVKALENL